MKNIQITNIPLKGMKDWFPEEFLIRKYIFDTWRKVCLSFGYQEYLTPLLENAEIYRAKSGEDVGGKELLVFADKSGKEIAIRPEMTPSVTRLVSRIYAKEPKPLRYFSIANFFRNEKPQRGRNREFWQLNLDIFGTNALTADVEIIRIGIAIMQAFTPPRGSFIVRMNNRKLLDTFLTDVVGLMSTQEVIRILDKYEKLTSKEFSERLRKQGVTRVQQEMILLFLTSRNVQELENRFPQLAKASGYQEITLVIDSLTQEGYGDLICFSPTLCRGFDYYDGTVFEVFDTNPANIRSLFGGGRYNGLAAIFGMQSFPAVGCAPGDETTYLFLQSWNLIDPILKKKEGKMIYFPVLKESLRKNIERLACDYREKEFVVETGLDTQSLRDGLIYANKKNFDAVILYGTNEEKRKEYLIKDLKTGVQESIPMNK